MKVLVVEDDFPIATFLVKCIEKYGYQAEKAETGLEAIEKVRHTWFDLVLLDIFLPDTIAFYLIPQLKGICPEIRIVTMIGQNTKELEGKIRELGIVYYMSKPFPLPEFRSILGYISKKQRQQKTNY